LFLGSDLDRPQAAQAWLSNTVIGSGSFLPLPEGLKSFGSACNSVIDSVWFCNSITDSFLLSGL